MVSPKFNKSRYGLDMGSFWSRDKFLTIAVNNALEGTMDKNLSLNLRF